MLSQLRSAWAKLSFRVLLVLLAAVPIVAFTVMGGSQAWTYFRTYQNLGQALHVQRLADAGASLAQALPAEVLAANTERAQKRAEADAALAEVLSAYDALAKAGIKDKDIDSNVAIIRNVKPAFATYRQHADAGAADAQNEGLFVLQPVSAAGLELIRRSSAMIGDLDLARLIEGYYALMQTNDSGMIEIINVKTYLAGAMTPADITFAHHAKALREIYKAPLHDFLPADVTAPYDAFLKSDQGTTIDTVRAHLFANDDTAALPADTLQKYLAAADTRATVLAKTIAATGTEISQIADNKLASSWNNFLAYLGLTIVLLAIAIALCLLIIHTISAVVRDMADNMRRLAGGELDITLNGRERKDELGDMARALEVFLDNAKAVQAMDKDKQLERERELAAQKVRDKMTEDVSAVVAAAGAGDFTARIDADYGNKDLDNIAAALNNLMEMVERGLGETGQVLAALADTNLTQRVTGTYQGAFDKLKTDTNAMADKLVEIVGQLKQTSRGVKSATGEILSGANDLSERTTKQAATIEETSAAMEQLAQTVMENAKRAGTASDQAKLASRTAEEGGEVMASANQAMERISNSSAKISNIIGMIDDIAFQTNLLALNASVEAARAGEAGKGFAVVAVEVRRLAQSAAEASSEVKVLIEKSGEEVSGGTRLVKEAAEKLSAILGAVRTNASEMEGIARESREQASAIEEVNTAVRQMDEMTQHNAALVEETNAAIEQTEAQASELDRIVEVFTLDDSAAATPARPGKTARAYLSKGNAALDKDWSEF